MADNEINVNNLPVKTAPEAGSKMMMIGPEEEYQIDYDQLASAILDKLSTKQYSELDTAAKTVLGALDELNGKIKSNFEIFTAGSYMGDCNEITEPGLFNQVINPDAVNGPRQYAYIIVYSASHFDMITQIAIPYNISGTLKVRTRESGTWRDWRTV